jgi:hypothetical protein
MGIFVCGALMALSVLGIGWLLPLDWPHWIHLAVQVLAGGIAYGLLIHIFKIEAYQDMHALVSEQIRLRRQRGMNTVEQ